MSNYRQRLQTVQAVQFTSNNDQIPDWAESRVKVCTRNDGTNASFRYEEIS